jgi:D-amino-acid dehydrogenase
MKILVLGSGVIGTSVAYYAARQGHDVTVVDRQPGPGMETSFANAGEVSPGYSAPWAGPGVPLKAIKWMLMRHSPLVVRPKLDPAMWRWMFSMLRNCTQERYDLNKGRMMRLAEYSRDCLKALRADIGISYDERTQGTVQLFRTHKQLEGAARDVAILRDQGVAYELLDRDGVLEHEPGLVHVRDKFVGALRLPGDETGDCFKFTQALATHAAGLGVKFRHGVTIEGIEVDGQRVLGVRTDKGRLQADVYVVAVGSYAVGLLRPIGIRVPVYPVKGYSITLRINDATHAPESTVMDETFKVAVTRLGDRIRVGGTAELAGHDLSLSEERRATLAHVVTDLFPGASDVASASFWCGLRPMTPDGTPIVGPTRYGNLHLSVGHGTLGWTMAAGTGRVLADLISRRAPDIDMGGLTIARYGEPEYRTHVPLLSGLSSREHDGSRPGPLK